MMVLGSSISFGGRSKFDVGKQLPVYASRVPVMLFTPGFGSVWRFKALFTLHPEIDAGIIVILARTQINRAGLGKLARIECVEF